MEKSGVWGVKLVHVAPSIYVNTNTHTHTHTLVVTGAQGRRNSPFSPLEDSDKKQQHNASTAARFSFGLFVWCGGGVCGVCVREEGERERGRGGVAAWCGVVMVVVVRK